MQYDHTKSVSDVEMTEGIQIIRADQDHMVGLRRIRTIRVTTQDNLYSKAACAPERKSWIEWFMALFLTGLRFVTNLRNFTFCAPTSFWGEKINRVFVLRGNIGCLVRTPLVSKNWIIWPTV